jgi:hypothetical protein
MEQETLNQSTGEKAMPSDYQISKRKTDLARLLLKIFGILLSLFVAFILVSVVGFSFVDASEYMDRLQRDAKKFQNDADELDKISGSLFAVATNCMVKHQEPSDKVREWAHGYDGFGITTDGKYTIY